MSESRIAELEATIAALSEEIEETNRGVVALYAELDDKAAQLREASDLKSRFLSYMSHEFRTPLGAMRSITRILLDRLDGPLTDEQELQVKLVKTAAEELAEMVDDLLDLAKVEAGRVTISPDWFDLVDLFSALRGMFKPLLASSSVTLTFEDPIDMPRLYTDDKKLSQVLRNFISNALKFAPNGEVRVTARSDGDGEVTFAVIDDGIGIAPENLPALFRDFSQIDSPLQRRVRGSGLGLALSKKLAELLGGNVDVQSEPGVGSTFSIRIPAVLPDHLRPRDEAAP